MARLIIIFLVIVFSACSTSILQEPLPPNIIPKPNSISLNENSFKFTKRTRISVDSESQKKVAVEFFNQFERVAGWTPKVSINDTVAMVVCRSNNEIAEEGYKLMSTKDKIVIEASTDAGIFYSLQTIKQLLPPEFVSNSVQTEVQWVIPAVEIIDEPRFQWRGFMLDVSRHFYQVEEVKGFIDMMAELKMNTFHLHLTDDQGWRLEIKKFPKLTEVGAWRVDYSDDDWVQNRWWGRPAQKPGDKVDYGGFYTQEEMKEIIQYAGDKFIDIVPEIDVPGHSQAIIASYPEVACHPGPYYVATGGVFRDNTLCPGKELTFEFLEDVLNEVMNLFPGKYIHIGGDECNKESWKADPDCQRRINEEGLENEHELQSYFIKRVEKMVNAKGKHLLGWDEILEGGLAPNATVMSWRGESGGIKAAKLGHNIVMTPSAYCYLDLKQGHTDHEPNLGYSQCLLSTCYNYNPVPESLEDQKDKILGIGGNLWTESLNSMDKATYMALPRLYAIAENGWSSQASEDWDDFINRLYPQLQRLDIKKVKYAKSAFNVWIDHRGNGNFVELNLHSEANGNDIRYTLDGSIPDTTSNVYTEPFEIDESYMVKAGAFKNGVLVSDITEKQFHVHRAGGAQVSVNQGGSTRVTSKLTDMNYGINWSADTTWQRLSGNQVELVIDLPTSPTTNTLMMNFLQVAISGIYMPEVIQISGSENGKTYFDLGELSLKEHAEVQGRYIHQAKIEYDDTKVSKIKVKLFSVNPIYEGHHRAGSASRIYLDELIVY